MLLLSLAAAAVSLTLAQDAVAARPNEVWSRAQEDAAGFLREHVSSPPPRLSMAAEDLPASFSWSDQDGNSLVTKSLNQHIPQYCVSLIMPPESNLLSPCKLWELIPL